MKLFETAPDGYFAGDLVVLWQPGEYATAVKGFTLELPDFRHALPTVLNELQDTLRVLLRALGEHQRLDWQWFCDSNFHAALRDYDAKTALSDNEWVRLTRWERHQRYVREMEGGQLRRERLAVFLAQPTTIKSSWFALGSRLRAQYEQVLKAVQEELERFGETLERLLGVHGVRVTPMTDADHYRHYFRFFNPSWAARGNDDPMRLFIPDRSIQENCWLSEGTGIANVGFWMDGFYHGILVVSRPPQITYPGIIHKLTRLNLPNYRLSLHIEPLSVRAEIAKEEANYRRLLGDLESEKKIGLKTVLEKKGTKVSGLMEGFLRAFRIRFLVRTWAPTLEALAAQTATLKQDINAMNGAQYFEPSLPATTRKFFFESFPGWGGRRCSHYKLYAEDKYLSDLIPFSSGFSGDLLHAEALYDGSHGGLVGLNTFSS